MERKEILKRARQAREQGDLELAGVLEDYNRLKNNYIPQLLKHFESKSASGLNYPHMLKLKEPSWLDRIKNFFL